jgi:hypothetical protein
LALQINSNKSMEWIMLNNVPVKYLEDEWISDSIRESVASIINSVFIYPYCLCKWG